VDEKWGITEDGIQSAIEYAKAYFQGNPDDQVVLYFKAGTFHFKQSREPGLFDLSGVQPGPNGRLIFQGAGMQQTTISTDSGGCTNDIDTISGRDVYQVTFKDMHFTRETSGPGNPSLHVSQGTVVKTTSRSLQIKILPGFPTPKELSCAGYPPRGFIGRYTRECTRQLPWSNSHVKGDEHNWPPRHNKQWAWKNAKQINGDIWELHADPNYKRPEGPNYRKGAMLGIKVKHGGEAFSIQGGNDFEFDSVKWTQHTRGVLRGGISNVRIANCVIEPAPPINGQTPCLASSGGGPQIGHPTDARETGISNITVENNKFTGTGDDAVAVFMATSGRITGNTLSGSFGRAMYICGHGPKTKNPLTISNNKISFCTTYTKSTEQCTKSGGESGELEDLGFNTTLLLV